MQPHTLYGDFPRKKYQKILSPREFRV